MRAGAEYVHEYTDRHGARRRYLRIKGQKLVPITAGMDIVAVRNAMFFALSVPAQSVIKKAFASAKSRANLRGLTFTLSLNDLAITFDNQNRRCALTGEEFRYSDSGQFHKSPFAPSIDRLNNDLGYDPENIRLVCVAANFALGEWGEEIFERIARGYLKKRARRRDNKMGIG